MVSSLSVMRPSIVRLPLLPSANEVIQKFEPLFDEKIKEAEEDIWVNLIADYSLALVVDGNEGFKFSGDVGEKLAGVHGFNVRRWRK